MSDESNNDPKSITQQVEELKELLQVIETKMAAMDRVAAWAARARKLNTDAWMREMANRLNKLLVICSDARRCVFDGDQLSLSDIRDCHGDSAVHNRSCCCCGTETGWVTWRSAKAQGWSRFETVNHDYSICPRCRTGGTHGE